MPPEPDEIPHDTQVTPAHVLGYMQAEITPRLNQLEETVNRHGEILRRLDLNGNTETLIKVAHGYVAQQTMRANYRAVWQDLGRRTQFLRPGKHWLMILLSGALGALGWQLASSAHLPGLP